MKEIEELTKRNEKRKKEKKKNLLMFLISYCLLTLDDERMDEKKEKC